MDNIQQLSAYPRSQGLPRPGETAAVMPAEASLLSARLNVAGNTPLCPGKPAGSASLPSESGPAAAKPPHLPYPKIKQFHDIVRALSTRCKKAGSPLPVLMFRGTVKLHGSNASVVHDFSTRESWAQSSSRVITVEQDNHGFAAFAARPKEAEMFAAMFSAIGGHRKPGENRAAVYGEWCGRGIQKHVAISDLSPRFVVFGVCLFKDRETRWLDAAAMHSVVKAGRGQDAFYPEGTLFSSEDFQSWSLAIDFSAPHSAVAEMIEITRAVEAECPVAKVFDVSGVGEGVVWKYQSEESRPAYPYSVDDLIFKAKGELHSETKVATLMAVDVEKVSGAAEFADKVVTIHRLEKKVETLREQGHNFDAGNVKTFINIVKNDIFEEEKQMIKESGLTHKAVADEVVSRARQWYLKAVSQS